MITTAVIVTLACLALPVTTQIRVWVTGREARGEIHERMSQHRQSTATQGAAPTPPRTVAAPRHPATTNEHEVSP